MKITRCVLDDTDGWALVGEHSLRMLHGAEDFGQAIALASATDESRAQSIGDAVPLESVRWLPPVLASTKIICAGVNYAKHAAEMDRQALQYPSMFVRFADSFVGHGEPVIRPRVTDSFDYEAEFVVVIGRTGRHIPEHVALDYVGGYTCMAENSARDYQKHNAQVTPGKNFDRSGSMGPWIVTSATIPDPGTLVVTGRLNGGIVQQAGVCELVCPVARLIAYVSTFTTLRPGDMIATGTPEGVGASRKPPRFMQAGDVFEVDIEEIGCLRNHVELEQEANR